VKAVNDIIELYNSGLSCKEISTQLNKSTTYIYNLLNINDVKFRSKSEANKIFPDFLLINLYNIELSTCQIVKLLVTHPTTVTKRFNKINFPLRDKHLAKIIGYSHSEFTSFFNNNRIKLMIEKVLDGIS